MVVFKFHGSRVVRSALAIPSFLDGDEWLVRSVGSCAVEMEMEMGFECVGCYASWLHFLGGLGDAMLEVYLGEGMEGV